MAPGKPGRPGKLPDLSDAEWEVMKVFWQNGPMAARDVFQSLPEGSKWAYRTVKTLLSRLVAKGALDYQQVGNSYLYRPAVSREHMQKREVRGFLQRVFDGSFSPLLAHFIEDTDLSDEELERLKNLIRQKEKDDEGGGS
jgi:BlaI family penicillinase repressor